MCKYAKTVCLVSSERILRGPQHLCARAPARLGVPDPWSSCTVLCNSASCRACSSSLGPGSAETLLSRVLPAARYVRCHLLQTLQSLRCLRLSPMRKREQSLTSVGCTGALHPRLLASILLRAHLYAPHCRWQSPDALDQYLALPPYLALPYRSFPTPPCGVPALVGGMSATPSGPNPRGTLSLLAAVACPVACFPAAHSSAITFRRSRATLLRSDSLLRANLEKRSQIRS